MQRWCAFRQYETNWNRRQYSIAAFLATVSFFFDFLLLVGVYRSVDLDCWLSTIQAVCSTNRWKMGGWKSLRTIEFFTVHNPSKRYANVQIIRLRFNKDTAFTISAKYYYVMGVYKLFRRSWITLMDLSPWNISGDRKIALQMNNQKCAHKFILLQHSRACKWHTFFIGYMWRRLLLMIAAYCARSDRKATVAARSGSL